MNIPKTFLNCVYALKADSSLLCGWMYSKGKGLVALNPKPDQYLIYKIRNFVLPLMMCEHKIATKNDLERVTLKTFLMVL